jgi:competence protein ComEA
LILPLRYDGEMVSVPRAMLASLGAALLTTMLFAQPPDPASAREASSSSKFPEGPGKAALLRVCSDCHGPESAVAQFKTREEWSKTLDEMAANGAQATDEEWNQILEYVDKNYSLILVNKSDPKRLANQLDVPESTAAAIVKYRDEHGRIASLDDLKTIPTLDAAKLEAMKDRFVF